MTDNYDKVSDAISDDQLAHSEQETELRELRDRIADLDRALSVAMKFHNDVASVHPVAVPDWFVACAAVLCGVKDDNGETARCLLDALEMPDPVSLRDAQANTFTDVDIEGDHTLRDRIAHLETPQVAAGVILRDTDAVSAMCKAARLSKAKTDEGEMPPLFDLLDFSGENKTRMVVFAAIYDALLAIAGETGE